MKASERKKAGKSPTQLTLNYLRKRGCYCAMTERWVKMKDGGFRKDVFGGDLMAIAGCDLINIQATSATNHAARLQKSLANPEVFTFLQTKNLFQIWSWKKIATQNNDGSTNKNGRWIPRITEIYLENGKLLTRPFYLNAR